jgi:eukaryotic-like serine/threonine-protein kinase
VLDGLGKRPEAEYEHRKGLAIQEKLVAEFPTVPEYRRELACSCNNLGRLLAGLRKLPEAEEQYRDALAILGNLAAEFAAMPEYQRDLASSHYNLGNVLAALGKQLEAEEQNRKALAIREKLVTEFPSVPEFRIDLGGSYCDFGALVGNRRQPGESLEWFERAIRTLTPVYEQDHRLVEARQFLRNSHWSRAYTYDRLLKFTEAIKDWDKAIELSPMEEKAGHRAARAASRLRAGQVAEAVAEVAELTKNDSWPAGSWYNFACVYSVASGKSAVKKQEYADRAMELLRNAVKAGWRDAAHMAKDTDLDPIRGREDFKKLIEGLAKKSSDETVRKP